MIICGAMAKWSIYIIFSSHFHFLHALSTLQIRRSSFFFSFIPNSSMKGGGVEIKNIGCTPINAIHTQCVIFSSGSSLSVTPNTFQFKCGESAARSVSRQNQAFLLGLH
mmetsp:Transcript_25560/g.64132  ORF Transcript_25560/g.64132 Transcript_25560/m.64132 type:complete len:109 (+) Transcript_25560:1158-1484(+)